MKKFFGMLILILATAVMGYGQATSTNGGSIQGNITDPTGANVSGATVTISDVDTGSAKTVTTDSAGFYSVGPLIPGNYNIAVSAAGFQKLSVKTVVRVGTATPGSFKMTLGASTETVEVNAGALQVNTEQIGVSGVVSREQIDSLPVNGRNILDVAQIQPGVILQSGESFDPTKAGYSAISVGGVSGRTTRILLDGQDITDETVGTTIFNVPSGAIDEFQLNRSTQDVSGEVTSTGQVLVSTQSGTNQYHGQAFFLFQDNNAGFASANGLNAPFQRNQFGGSVGGPILKDKLFFFGDVERIHQAAQNAVSVTPAFSSISSQYPYTPAPFHDTYSTVRLDYNAPKGVHLFVRGTYSVNSDDSAFGFIYSIYQNRDNIPAIVGGADFTTGKFTHSFRVGYEKFHNILGDGTAALGNSIYNPSTAASGNYTLYDPFDSGGFYAGPNYLAPQQTYQSDKQFRYDATWTKGAHTVKFGYNLNYILGGGFAEFFGASLFTEFSTANLLPSCFGASSGAPCPSDPVNGYSPTGYLVGNGFGSFSAVPGFGLPGGGVHDWREGAYVADTWKISPDFTAVYGLRWSVDTDRANQNLPTPLCSSVDPSLQFAGCSSTDGSGNTALYNQFQPGLGKNTHQPYANFGPQAGFVFSPGDHKMSIHGGIGIYYENTVFNNSGNAGPAAIQSPGKFQNDGGVCFGQSTAFLPGLGSVSSVNGVPLSTICNESIAQAAPQINALKSAYQAAVASSTSANPSFIGTGGGLVANGIYGEPYVSPYSIQYNGGVQREIAKGLILSADYVHNSTIKAPLVIDVNHVGAARFLDLPSAQAAISATTNSFGCAGGFSSAAINCAIAAGATISDFSGNGLDSGNAEGGTPAGTAGFAFGGRNRNVGLGKFILPVGRSGYDAAQIVLQQQKIHPVPGIMSSNLQISYSLSRIVSSTGGTATSDQFFNPPPYDYDNPSTYMGRNEIDHSNEVSFGGSATIKYGLKVGIVGHFFSAPPSTLTLDTNGGGVANEIFQTDVTGDGSVGDVVPGSEVGAYMHSVKGAGLNKLINNYNSTMANTPTPAGQALISAGLFTQGQLLAINAVQQRIASAPNNPLNNPAFRAFDMSASYPIRFPRWREGLSLEPGVAMYNIFNMSNFGTVSNGVLLNVADLAATGNGGVGSLNGPNTQAVLNATRIQRGSGTFDQGAPRSTEFSLKLNF
jgi:Carboxypeptidase regulatory-like domain